MGLPSSTKNSTSSTNQEQGGLLSVTRNFLLFVAFLVVVDDGDGSESEPITGFWVNYCLYGCVDSPRVIAENKKDYDNNVEELRKLITERILLGDNKYACAEWT